PVGGVWVAVWAFGGGGPQPIGRSSCCICSRSCWKVWFCGTVVCFAYVCACATSESRRVEFCDRLSTMRMESTFTPTTSTRARTACTHWVFRLYQPLTRSIELLNQTSMFCFRL